MKPSPIDIRIGLELTFLPNKPGKWKEFRDFGEAKEAARALGNALEQNRVTKGVFRAKTDCFRFDPHDAWIIEVNNVAPFISSCIDESYWPHAKEVQTLYKEAAKLGLRPYRESTRKGVITQSPTGGGHIHLGIDLWNRGPQYLIKLAMFERSLCIDFANHPYIKWLFSQWFDDNNSEVAVDLPHAKALRICRNDKRVDINATVHDLALDCRSIIQRFANTGKQHYPTYELRFFDMPRTVDELKLQIDFLRHWVGYHVALVDSLEAGEIPSTSYTLTPRRYRRFKDRAYLIGETQAFFSTLGLDFKRYTCFTQRNLINRLRYGQLV